MSTAIASMRSVLAGTSRGAAGVTLRSGPDRSLLMIECAGSGGEARMSPAPVLLISQCVGEPFHFQSNLGAGPFCGQALPMDFVVVAPDAPAWCRIATPHRLRFLALSREMARACLQRDADDPLDFGALHARHHRDPMVAQALDAIWHELALGDDTSSLFVEHAVAAVLARLARLAGESRPERPPHHGLTARQCARVIGYMRDNLAHRLPLTELAALVDLSPWHFARAFRARHGMPPHRYLVHLRLERARDLLARSSLSVTEIAAATGYSSQHFARRFRRQIGCTPTAYRHRTRG